MSPRLFASPPEVLRWVPRSDGHGDCAVAALELACGVTYESALAAALKVCPTVLVDGMTTPEIIRSARRLGYASRAIYKYDIDEDTGILVVDQPHVEDAEHAVYLWEGRIIEPMNARQQLWLQAKDYLAHYHYTAGQLITVTRRD